MWGGLGKVAKIYACVYVIQCRHVCTRIWMCVKWEDVAEVAGRKKMSESAAHQI